MTVREIVAAFVFAIFGLLGWLGKEQLANLQDKIRMVQTNAETQNRVQWEKISKLESEINYLRGYREGYKCGLDRKQEHP